MIFSIEYCHYDGTIPVEEVITFTNEYIEPLLKLHPQAQKAVMFDDLHADLPFAEFQKQTANLKTKPDSVYSESAFEPLVKHLVDTLQAKGFGHEKEGEHT